MPTNITVRSVTDTTNLFGLSVIGSLVVILGRLISKSVMVLKSDSKINIGLDLIP